MPYNGHHITTASHGAFEPARDPSVFAQSSETLCSPADEDQGHADSDTDHESLSFARAGTLGPSVQE